MATITTDLSSSNPVVEKARKKLVKQQNHEIRMLEQKKRRKQKRFQKIRNRNVWKFIKCMTHKLRREKKEHIVELEALVANMSVQGGDAGNEEKGNVTEAGDVEISAEEKRKQEEEARIRKKRESPKKTPKEDAKIKRRRKKA